MAREFYIKEDDHYGLYLEKTQLASSGYVKGLFLDNPETMRIRFEKNKERLRKEDKKLGKKARGWFTPAQKYTTL